FAGLRQDPALRLLVEDLDLAESTIRVRKTAGIKRAASTDRARINDQLKAILEGWLPRSGCKRAFPGDRRIGPLTKGIANARLKAVSGLAWLAGLRRGELLDLRTEDVDLGRSMVTIAGRPPVSLSSLAAGILGAWLGRPDRSESIFVFPGASLAGPWGVSGGK